MARIIKKLFRCRRCSLLPIAVPASKRVDVGFFFFLVTRAPMTALYCACLYWNCSDLHLDTGTAHRKWRQVHMNNILVYSTTGICVCVCTAYLRPGTTTRRVRPVLGVRSSFCFGCNVPTWARLPRHASCISACGSL